MHTAVIHTILTLLTSNNTSQQNQRDLCSTIMANIVRRLRKSSKTYEEIQERSLIKDFILENKSEVSKKELKAAQKLWDYMLLNHQLCKCDVIVVCGNGDVRTAEYACTLWLEGWADYILFSGHKGSFSNESSEIPEHELFRTIAVKNGIPEQKVLLEQRATNLGENIRFSHEILRMNGIKAESIILIHMPFMERRTHATFMKQWPEYFHVKNMDVIVKSPPITMLEYPVPDVGNLNEVISMMVGTLQRIKDYIIPGFLAPQKIPNEVSSAYKELLVTGKYSDHLLENTGKSDNGA